MDINFVNFTPLPAAIGGAILGIASAMMFLFQGRIAGISGILGNMLQAFTPQRLAFIAGLLISPWLVITAGFDIQITHAASVPVVLGAGLLVGIGTRMGSGCTSGHGICGLSRFSPRSLVAVITFMVTASLTVFIVS